MDQLKWITGLMILSSLVLIISKASASDRHYDDCCKTAFPALLFDANHSSLHLVQRPPVISCTHIVSQRLHPEHSRCSFIRMQPKIVRQFMHFLAVILSYL